MCRHCKTARGKASAMTVRGGVSALEARENLPPATRRSSTLSLLGRMEKRISLVSKPPLSSRFMHSLQSESLVQPHAFAFPRDRGARPRSQALPNSLRALTGLALSSPFLPRLPTSNTGSNCSLECRTHRWH